VTLRVTDPARPAKITSVVNAASYAPGPIYAGEIVMISGEGLGPDIPVSPTVVAAGELPYTLGGTSVYFQQLPAPLLYVDARQVLAIAPITYDSFAISVKQSGKTVATFQASGGGPSPGIFSADASGKGHAAALNSDGSANSPSSPAARGSLISVFVTGHGGCFVDVAVTGWPPIRSPYDTHGMVAEIGGEAARVVFAGSPPGSVCGLQRVDLIVPENSPTGDAVPLRIWSGYSNPAQSGITLAIQ
jgi:uncharacterized protein (TIGR03437 family)